MIKKKITIGIAIALIAIALILSLPQMLRTSGPIGDDTDEVPQWIIDISNSCVENYLERGYSNYRTCQLQEPTKVSNFCKENYLELNYSSIMECIVGYHEEEK